MIFSPSKYKDMAYDSPGVTAKVSRPLNTWWLVNDQRGSTIKFSVTINTNATLLAGMIGQVVMETGTSIDGGLNITPDATPLDVATTGLNAGLLNPGGPQTVTLSGPVDRLQYARIRSVNVQGAPTYTNPYTNAINSAYGWESYNR